MAVSLVQDFTTEFNAASALVLDVNGWDYVIVQAVTPSGAMAFTGSNDGGAIQGSTQGNATTAANFLTLAAVSLASTTPTTYITSVNASGLFRFDFPPQFIKLSGTSITVVKLIVKFHKIG